MSSASKTPKRLEVGGRQMAFGSHIIPMKDSTDLYKAGDYSGIRQRLAQDGFVLVRGVIQTDRAREARKTILSHIAGKGAIKPNTNLMDANMADAKMPGWTVDAESGGVVDDRDPDSKPHIGWAKIGNSQAVRDVYCGDDLKNFYYRVFNQKKDVKPLPSCTWLRMKGAGEQTQFHCDYFYFRHNTDIFAKNVDPEYQISEEAKKEVCLVCSDPSDPEHTLLCDLCSRPYHSTCLSPPLKELPGEDEEWHCDSCANSPFDVYTCWISMSDIKYHNGALAMCPGTHRLSGYERNIRRQLPGEYKLVEADAQWQTTEYGLGDVVLFNIKTIHAATKNTSQVFRISCDTRVCATRFDPDQATTPAYAERVLGSIDHVAGKTRHEKILNAIVRKPSASSSSSAAKKGKGKSKVAVDEEEEEEEETSSMGGMGSMSGMSSMGGMMGGMMKKPIIHDEPTLTDVSNIKTNITTMRSKRQRDEDLDFDFDKKSLDKEQSKPKSKAKAKAKAKSSTTRTKAKPANDENAEASVVTGTRRSTRSRAPSSLCLESLDAVEVAASAPRLKRARA